MPLVRVRILLGKDPLGVPTRPFSAEVTIQAVVDQALQPFEGVELVGAIDVFNDPKEAVRTAELPLESLAFVSVGGVGW